MHELEVWMREIDLAKPSSLQFYFYRLQTQGYQKQEQERALAACWKTRAEPHP